MTKIPFPSVYKFSSLNINSLSALAEGKAWFSKLADFNDPFEGQFVIETPDFTKESEREKLFAHEAKKLPFNVMKESALDLVRYRYNQSPADYERFFKDLVESTRNDFYNSYLNTGAYCVASDIPDTPMTQVSNALMWSHYADGMRGFCIKFDANKFYSSLNYLNEDDFYWSPVHYEDKLCIVDYYDFDNMAKNATTRAIHTKHSGWEYEYECRFITQQSGLYEYNHDAIECIYIGDKMPVSHQRVLLDICEKNLPNVDIVGVRTHKSSYSIELGKYIKTSLSK